MERRIVPVSVVICTRDRPADLNRCLESLALLDPQPLEVIVVDQGSPPAVLSSATLRVLHRPIAERGLSRARNHGLGVARGDVIAFLDDDCVVGATWAGDVAAIFERDPDAGIVFGTVIGVSADPDDYVPAYAISRERRLVGRTAAARAHGIGAAMYLRAATAAVVGTFDTRLGAGGEFRSSEDWDYSFRALCSGTSIVETPTVVVRHLGAKRYSDGTAARLLRWNAFSHGAVHAKLLRCGDWIAIVLMSNELLSLTAAVRPWNALWRRPTNAARLYMYVRGLGAGLRAPVSKSEMLFREVVSVARA
ncbi:MAG: glycosyltransferase family 2 protein [Chloroflexi bacterium]|nr:MAG: glycosyltransferase family 2 protein [Chloroflexota bacterium]